MSKPRITRFMAAILAGLLAFSTGVWAERPPGVGGGKGGGGGNDAGNEPPDYGDLFVLYRDDNGVPYLTADDCQQPLAAETFDGCLETLDGDCLIIPVDPATCGVLPAYVTLTQEVDFGRINEVRSPDSVFEAQLEDATIKLATAGCVSLDPAGRLVGSSLVDPDPQIDGDEYVTYATIDSPLQNLAMYRQLILEGTLGDGIPLYRDPLDAAATSIGAASDKSGWVGKDLIAYVNEIMGLTDEASSTILDPKICINVKEEVMGVIQHVRKCYLDYSAYNDGAGYRYNRRSNFEGLPHPAYIVPDGETEPAAGVFEYLWEFDEANHYFMIATGPIMDAFIPLWLEPAQYGGDIEFDGGTLVGFAKAADDARRMIEFMHTWPVPGGYETPVSCDAGADLFYDVSISADSGLQVPKRMVAGTEGREGTVTVANAGPADATGVLRLIGVDTDGAVIGPLYLVEDGVVTETELFVAANDHSEEFTLPAGHSASWIFFFSVDYPTRITWTATAIAEHDVNPANDEVTEVTLVSRTTGGGGH